MHTLKMGFGFIGNEERLKELQRELMDSARDFAASKQIALMMSETQIEDMGEVVSERRSQVMTNFPKKCPCGLDDFFVA